MYVLHIFIIESFRFLQYDIYWIARDYGNFNTQLKFLRNVASLVE